MTVPLCDLQGQYRRLQPEFEQAISRVLASGQVILGPEVAMLQREAAEYCGAAFGVGCGSGTDAISLSLHAIGIGKGDEVIIPPFTFFATAGCVVRAGATPVFADIDPVTFNIDSEQVARRITPRTKAIMPVHLYGQCADMKPLWDLAAKHGLHIIEDACQAFGAEYQGKKAGTLGAIACFSFYPSKTLGAYGDAGLAVTNDPEWADRMQVLRVHGMKPKYFHRTIGWMGRIDAIQAAILRVKLRHVNDWVNQRRTAATRYTRLISDHNLREFVTTPVENPDGRHSFSQYVVRIADGKRDALVRHFQSQKIGCEIYYPLCLHQQDCLKYLGHKQGDFPVSEQAADCVLALPMFPEITMEQQTRVIENIAEFCRNQVPLRRAA